ncbi:LytTR family DNA-binding domain-containing protein [Pricia sp. S334]|uniref:LytTR family DNA-binding domain-containing protein n=1 Tax=Pricia mediterranea TaxID=3076079 RepID=A0ABU3L2S2_9FLAO|nr:LytTR family DNA-binding domain-containing protein [Pricia sp. S334]MDT7827558.1 LytTR family DNA-binding domain-containing protein [Pricia sp. S334]
MLRAILVEDERHCQDRLRHLLRRHEDFLVLECTASTVEDAKVAILLHRPEVVFLDVQLRGRTGFELLKEIPNISFEVIFTTAFDRYAVEAFRFSALDYLLKPIAEEDLIAALEKLKKKISQQEICKKLEVLFQNLEENRTGDFQKIAVPTVDGLSMISIDDILRFQSDSNYTHLFLIGGKRLTVAKTLKYFVTLLEKHHFYRTHHSHLINLIYVDKYQKGKGGLVLMTDGSHVEIAVRRKEEFLKRLMGKS